MDDGTIFHISMKEEASYFTMNKKQRIPPFLLLVPEYVVVNQLIEN